MLLLVNLSASLPLIWFLVQDFRQVFLLVAVFFCRLFLFLPPMSSGPGGCVAHRVPSGFRGGGHGCQGYTDRLRSAPKSASCGADAFGTARQRGEQQPQEEARHPGSKTHLIWLRPTLSQDGYER